MGGWNETAGDHNRKLRGARKYCGRYGCRPMSFYTEPWEILEETAFSSFLILSEMIIFDQER